MFRRSSHTRQATRRPFPFKKMLIRSWVFLLVLALAGAGWWFLSTNKTSFSFILDQVSCADEGAVKRFLEKEEVKFYWLQGQEIQKKLKQQFSCVSEVWVDRQFPTTVVVTMTGRKPVAVFRVIQKIAPSPLPLDLLEATASTQAAVSSPPPQVTVSYGETFLVDDQGVGFAKGSDEKLPLIDFAALKFDIGDSIGKEKIQRVLQILDFFRKLGISTASLELDGDSLRVKTTEEIIFSLAEGLERQGASLQLIWKQAKMSSKSVVKIDLRFDKPVVTYLPEKR